MGPRKRRIKRRLRKARRGYSLVLFAMLLFGLFGLVALLVDMGFVRLARLQMQSASDSAALEGLRFRDDMPESMVDNLGGYSGATPHDPHDPDWRNWLNERRRELAARRVSQSFDDDLDPENGDALNFGAGPNLDFSGGVDLGNGFSGSQTMSIPAQRAYKPSLQSNLGDAAQGDQVAGSYDRNATNHSEASDYSRSDFSPGDGDTAFLVRMRRTAESPEAGVSDIGRPLPTIFARGSLLANQLKGAGISIRSTSIADARPAMSVGSASPSDQIPGATAFVVLQTAWQDTNLWSAALEVELATNGDLLNQASGERIGFATSGQVAPSWSVGEFVDRNSIADPNSAVAGYLANASTTLPVGYAPIVLDQPGTFQNAILGFGAVLITDDASAGDSVFILQRLAGRFLGENTTSTFSKRLPEAFAEPSNRTEVDSFFAIRNGLTNVVSAPALSRSTSSVPTN